MLLRGLNNKQSDEGEWKMKLLQGLGGLGTTTLIILTINIHNLHSNQYETKDTRIDIGLITDVAQAVGGAAINAISHINPGSILQTATDIATTVGSHVNAGSALQTIGNLTSNAASSVNPESLLQAGATVASSAINAASAIATTTINAAAPLVAATVNAVGNLTSSIISHINVETILQHAVAIALTGISEVESLVQAMAHAAEKLASQQAAANQAAKDTNKIFVTHAMINLFLDLFNPINLSNYTQQELNKVVQVLSDRLSPLVQPPTTA